MDFNIFDEMLILNRISLKGLFHLLCIIGTAAIGIDCLLKYIKNEDVSRSDYQNFHRDSEDNIYPSLSFCIINPFLENRFARYGDGINTSSYMSFLQGRYWDDRMLHIDFDAATVSLKQSLKKIMIKLHDHKRTELVYNFKSSETKPKWAPTFNVSFRSAFRKCYTFDIPFVRHKILWQVHIFMDNSIFPNGIRPIQNPIGGDDLSNGELKTYFHYPGQRFSSYYTAKEDWDVIRPDTLTYSMIFRLSDIQVIKYRNKRSAPCVRDWRGHDQYVMDKMMLEVGCRPPQWNTTKNLPLCSTQRQMKKYQKYERQPSVYDLQHVDPPCLMIKNLYYRYSEVQYPWIQKGNLKKIDKKPQIFFRCYHFMILYFSVWF